ncbi:HupE/UreJ family protein [Pseudoduganella chitinolytica]|uniref:HupE/UreJ family protein n=1 Tax=Pseudoduganella chitinolytica TaxID=34070 RepID=A0ABY8BJE0_9BURK|nr:HupE/UreJ family protein [Pseudoduganella chitinolytica]WEF34807.1 HupE/UreJ family protein [Pseudoduganella chitinolytica]
MKHQHTIALAALLYSGAALAHPGHAEGALAGLLHPLTGLDHVLAMLAVGLWGAQLGGRAQWLLPAGFVACLALGGALGMAGYTLPLVEAGIVTSVLLLGMLIGFAVRLPVGAALAAVGVFALFHGFAHGSEMPAHDNGWLYALGFVAASAALHGAGLWLGRGALAHGRWLRGSGAAISLAGVWLAVAG